MKKEEEKKIVNELNNSLVYAMSLGSKELFHSNVWAWLFRYNQDFVKIFFENIGADDEIKVTREENDRDITVWVNGEAYVIENKFKSLPDKEQLVEYETKLVDKFKQGVITGIKKPIWMDEVKNWSFIGYSEIVEKMREIASNIKDDKGSVIKEYVEILDKSLLLIEGFEFTIGDNWVVKNDETEEWLKMLDSVRLADVCQKLQADRFVEYIKKQDAFKKYIDNTAKYGWELVARPDFSHKTGLVDVMCYKYANSSGTGRRKRQIIAAIGIQIQDKSYKKIMMMNNSASDIYEKSVNVGWLSEKWSDERKKVSRQKDSRFKQYDQHGGNFFIYHDWEINEKERSFVCLWEKMSKDIKIAIDKLSSL